MTQRQLDLLKIIVEDFIAIAIPIASKTLIEKHNLTWSSALIRNEMNELEKLGYLEKLHTSGGRIPTSKSYKYYVSHLMNNDTRFNEFFTKKLEFILNDRSLNIEQVIKESLNIISEATNLVAVVSDEDYDKDEILSAISVHQTTEKSVMILLITSKNNVINKVIEIPKKVKFKDIQTSVAIFNERLVGTSLKNVEKKALALKDIITTKVINLERDFQLIIQEIFQNLLKVNTYHSGISNITKYEEFNKETKILASLLSIIEKNSIWELLRDQEKSEIGTTQIMIGSNSSKELKMLSIFEKELNIKGKKHNLALVGPQRVNYSLVTTLLEWLSEKLNDLEGE